MILKEKFFDTYRVQLAINPEANVHLIDGTSNPIESITKVTRGYKGEFSTRKVSNDEMELAVYDLNHTKLGTPFEMASFIFLISRVTRSFTHQLVRTRMASYVQESMRFLGHQSSYTVLVSESIYRNDKLQDDYFDSVCSSIKFYEEALSNGISSEDARDILPHGILTSIFACLPLSSIKRMYEQRMCCQAQPGQWQIIMRQIKSSLREMYGDEMNNLISAPFERGEPCGYRASFDRPCKWTEKPYDVDQM